MKYQEKVKFVDKAIAMIRDDVSRETIEDFLRKEGLKSWDIKKVNQSIDNRLRSDYKSKIKEYLLDDSLESKLSEFDEMDADLFEKIQHEIISEIKIESREKVKSMTLASKSEEEILNSVTNSFFGKEEVYEILDQIGERKNENKNHLNKGIGFLVAGVILTIGFFDIFAGEIMVFTGLIGYGIFYIFQSKRNN